MDDRIIEELEGLSLLERLEKAYEREFGLAPMSLSHWDPSDEVMTALLKHLKLPEQPLPIPYIYSDALRKPTTLELLGFNPLNSECCFVQSGTVATVLVCWWLKFLGIRQVLILCPAYFSVFYALDVVGLEYQKSYLRHDVGAWQLRTDEILALTQNQSESVAVWVTNPVYCTGIYLKDEDLAFLNSLLDNGVAIVADECLCLTGREIGARFSASDRFVGIYSPHKSVCINAVKFGAVLASVHHQNFFDRWSDVLTGNLTASNYSAISHFCDQNFSKFYSAFAARMAEARDIVFDLIRNDSASLEVDSRAIGHYVSCYSPKIQADLGMNADFLRKLTWETGASIISGANNHFPPDAGFSFRINLARANTQFFSALQRTIEFLDKVSEE